MRKRANFLSRTHKLGLGNSGERPMDPALYREYWVTSHLNRKHASLMREMHAAGYAVRYLQRVFGVTDWRLANMICKQDW